MAFYYDVVLEIALNKTFTYKSDAELDIGQRVLIEFINKKVVGFIWQQLSLSQIDYSIDKIKPILHEFNECLTNDVIEIVKFINKYYHYPIGQSLFAAIPSLFRKSQIINLDYPKTVCLINKDHELFNKKISDKQKKLYELLQHQNLNIEYDNNTISNIDITNNTIALNNQQQKVVDEISTKFNSYVPTLLYGITGSGKTEVYLELIRLVINNGKQVLVLVPEINLTPQLLDRFKRRFPNINMHILTSNINDKQRVIAYLEASKGLSHVIIGTRMAIFTTFKSLGLIIVDEEHDSSFKQNESLRYNARDLAVYRAKSYNIPIILGSATPSLESLYNYKIKKYLLFKLSSRGIIGAQLPKIKLIDLNVVKISDGLTNIVLDAVKARLNNHELSLIYINRRGYAPVISCYECGWISRCKNCSTNMVYHSNNKLLKCHHCGLGSKLPVACPKCNSKYLQAVGQGTQKIEEVLTEHFPEARILRIDQDTTNNKKAWDEVYNKVHNHQVDILVGTQMLTKGHDFHNLTLVVGLNLDSGLYSYDFRSTEFLFTQLMQVSGRAGRGTKNGEVLLQTYYPTHELYQFLLRHDFAGFANYLLKQRKLLRLPPYIFYVLLRASSAKIEYTMDFLQQVYIIMQQNKIDDIEVFQPVSSVMQRLKNRERGQILFSSANRNILHNFIDNVMPIIDKIKHKSDLLWHIDIDPIDM
jgi:primosomal protein N' (replication factor Y)